MAPAAATAWGPEPWALSASSVSHSPASSITMLVSPSARPSSTGHQCAIHDMPDRLVNGSYRQTDDRSSRSTPR